MTQPTGTTNGIVALQTSAYTASALSPSTVDASGGTLTVSGTTDPLFGASIVVPAGALTEPVTVSLSSAAITSLTGLPAGTAARSRVIQLQLTTVANGTALAALPQTVMVTLPYDATTDYVGYYQVEAGGALESMGASTTSAAARTISFRTRAPGVTGAVAAAQSVVGRATAQNVQRASASSESTSATYIAVGLSQAQFSILSANGSTVDSGFLPSKNGFYIPNYGSYYNASQGGNCFGMVGFAKYYYQVAGSPNLADNYRDAQKTDTWVDDSVAIEVASRVHNSMSAIWDTYWQNEAGIEGSAKQVALSLVGALYVTHRPALLAITQEVNNVSTGSHAISVYAVTINHDGSAEFYVYDPNFPRDDTRLVTYGLNSEGFDNYASGTTSADSSYSYNSFKHVGFSVGLTPAELATDKADADAGYPASVFPTVTVTSITGNALGDDVLANTATTTQGQPEYKTSDRAVVITGTVLGGSAQTAGNVVTNINVVTPSGTYKAAVDNQAGGGTGAFTITVPLKGGVNPIALLAADPNLYSHWAAFKEVLVESTAAPSYFTVTLNWDKDTSDLDLYVKEPDGAAGTANAGKVGDIVYYAHREGLSPSAAYLDFDNTSGYGPENYVVSPGLTTEYNDGTLAASPNGSFKVGVEYFNWSGDPAADKSVGWTVKWRLLTACRNGCANPETDGLWVTGTKTGTVTTDDSGQDGDEGFNAPGTAWSPQWTIDFPAAMTTWTVPPSNTIMLP